MNLRGIFIVVFAVTCVFAGEKSVQQKEMLKFIKMGVDSAEQAWVLKQHESYRAQQHHGETPVKFEKSAQFTVYNNKAVLKKTTASASSVTRILLLVNSTLYSNSTAKAKIDRYASDIGSAHSCKVELVAMSGGTYDSVKNVIKTYYNDKTNGSINGVIQIGSLPLAWFENRNDFDLSGDYGTYNNFTCDLYYMDLDGTWLDTLTYSNSTVSKGSNKIFDGHIKGSGDLGPEVFYARIDPSTMGTYGTEATLLGEYLDKDHNFWTGSITVNDSAMYYLTYDWYDAENYVNQVYGSAHTAGFNYNVSNVSNNTVTKSDYVNNRITYQYSILHMWCHANYNIHAFYDGSNYDELTMESVYSAKPKPIAYFQDGCHLNDFAAGENKAFLGGCYVFNKSPTALVCFGGSKSGQWIGCMGKGLFTELNKNTSLGQAFQIWFSDYITSDQPNANDLYFTSWNYGYNIIGDPMLTFISQNIVPVRENSTMQQTLANERMVCTPDASGKMITVSYVLPQNSMVDIAMYDMAGKRVQTIMNAPQVDGSHSVKVDTRSLAEGVYVVSLSAGLLNTSKQVRVAR